MNIYIYIYVYIYIYTLYYIILLQHKHFNDNLFDHALCFVMTGDPSWDTAGICGGYEGGSVEWHVGHVRVQ